MLSRFWWEFVISSGFVISGFVFMVWYLQGEDGVTFYATNGGGDWLTVGLNRRRQNGGDILLQLGLQQVGMFQHPIHPHQAVWTSSDHFSADNLKIELLHPRRRWRISYNGWLRYQTISVKDNGKFQISPIQLGWVAWKNALLWIKWKKSIRIRQKSDSSEVYCSFLGRLFISFTSSRLTFHVFTSRFESMRYLGLTREPWGVRPVKSVLWKYSVS